MKKTTTEGHVISRRRLLAMLGLPALQKLMPAQVGDQGMATRGLKPQAPGKKSGLPFNSLFTDVAQEAGLTAQFVSGGLQHNTYIVEAMGSGCAFFDFDNDGWLDV